MTREVDVAILGAGSAGLFALSQVRRETDNYVLINGGELGTTCARVGCMPSKSLIRISEYYHEREYFEKSGIKNSDDVVRMAEIGVDAILVGETLVRSKDVMQITRALVAAGQP